MGGKVSRAKRACETGRTTSVKASGDITGDGLGAGYTREKTYDTACVQSMLGKN
jgi:hypothetical protein